MCRTCGKRHNSYDMANPTSNGSHDVNLEAAGSIPFSLGLRSPGKTSPLRSRNLKEYEDQLEHLKKENFSLKLRIYFLEERISHKPIQQDKEELYNANVELKVETEALKKELGDKQELVRQAAALLTNMENKFKEQLEAQQETHKRETQELREAIDSLQKEVDKYREGVSEDGVGDLTRLCGLAFNSAEGDDDITFNNARSTKAPAGVTPSTLQGVFSLQDPCAYPDGSLSDPTGTQEPTSEAASRRIKELEEEVEVLTKKVQTLEKTLEDKDQTTQALNEDIENLKKEIDDREDKLNDLEQEVNEKDVRVDQLMQELETRHLEIEARDSTIENLHHDLNKVEPQIEVKVQECMEKDRIIEEKKEQLHQQSKILVEIQITLDEKQKQIAELEESLRQETLKVQTLDEHFNKSLKTIKDMADRIVTRDKEILHLKTQLRRKEKKVRDLIAELKEALDMLQKAKWEAETNGGQDGVKEMAEDENERLWAELEQEKLKMKTLTAEKETFMEQAKTREEDLNRQKAAVEEQLRLLQKEYRSDGGSERDKEELHALREKLSTRDALQQSQEALLGTLKEDLGNTKAELKEKRDELWMVKKELSKRSFDMHDLIMKGFLGGSEDVKNLTKKLSESSMNRESPLEALKLFMEANKLKSTPEHTLCKQSQARSNSLSRLNDEPQKKPSAGAPNPPKSPKPARSNSLSLLESALFANMGQKVSNTNQTFNTYIVSGEAEGKPSEGSIPLEETACVVPSEVMRINTEGGEVANTIPTTTRLKNNIGEELNKRIHTATPLAMKTAVPEGVSISQPCKNISEGSLQILHAEVSKVRSETQALRKDREELSEKVAALQEANDRLTSQATATCPLQEYQAMADEVEALKKTIQQNGEDKLQKERAQIVIVSDYQEQIDNLKAELKGVKRRITMQLLQTASAKYQEAVKGYKQEITSLRKRLADSHNACDLLRTRLEELVDFLEQVLDMDRKGLIDLSHLSVDQRASLQKSLDDSRSLSHSLSHSLMIGTESVLGDSVSVNDETASRFFLPLEGLPEEVNLSQFELCVADGNLSHLNMLAMDLTGDTMNQSFAAKIFSQMDDKTEEIDAITTKLSQLNAVLESKDEQLRVQTDTVLDLQNQVSQLREEIQAKDQLLKEVNENPENTLLHSDTEYPALDSPNETAPSLHLSLLQHSLPSPSFDSRIHEGLLTAPEETSSSDTLPPPPHSISSLEDSESRLKSSRKMSSDVGAEKHTSVIFRKLPRLSDLSFSRSTFATAGAPPHCPTPGTPLEQQLLQPSLALASPSESEAWSEPDRNVSFARIGLDASNLVSLSHDRSLSRSRMTKSAPFTSESDGDDNPEETKEGSVGLGTPSSSKPKRRSDAAEVKRLSGKLRTIEQLNETLRAELHIYQTLNEQYNVTPEDKERTQDKSCVSENSSSKNKCVISLKESENSSKEKTAHTDGVHPLPSSLLQEIRSLRIALEEAIAKYDLLKDQLEAALAGYLTEEARNLTQRLSSVEQELKISQEKLIVATKAEDLLRNQVQENECKTFELGESLAEYMTRNQSLEKRITEMNEELAEKKSNLIQSENELKVDRALREEKELAEREVKDSRYIKMEMEIRSLKLDLNKMQQIEIEKERKVDEQKKCIVLLEETKADYEKRLLKQDSEIKGLCENIKKLQQETAKSSATEELVFQLQEALQKGESRLLEVTKERFALVGEKARLQAQLASVSTHATLLQKEVKEFSISEEITNAEPNYSELLLRLKDAKTTIFELQRNKELFQSEKIAMQKEIELMQEELLGLKSQLDHVLSRDAVTSSREVRELAGLQMSYSKLKDKYSYLESTYKNLLVEKNNLEEALQELKTKEKELSPLKRCLKEVTCSRDEVRSRLEEEQFLTRSLQMQLRDITSGTSYKVPSDNQNFGRSNSAAEISRPGGASSPSKCDRGASSYKQTENKENRSPHYTHARGTLSLPLIDDDGTSGDSPDLGIGSDGQFSSLERLGGCRVRHSFDTVHKGRKREHERMCSEPSHNRLISEIESLRDDRESLSKKLSSTNERLNVALAQLTKANQRKEALDKVICKQLTKTHNVLRKASGNLRQAGNQKNPTSNQQQQTN